MGFNTSGLRCSGGMRVVRAALFCAVGLLVGRLTAASDNNHKYVPDEPVTVWVNKVGPERNPQESYLYYSLPFCKPSGTETNRRRKSGLGEVLAGNQLRDSGIDMRFKVSQERRSLCDMTLDDESTAEFKRAVRERYVKQMFVDDLPFRRLIGTVNEGAEQIYLHQKFIVDYNNDRIISINYELEDPQSLIVGDELQFTYEVQWRSVDTRFEDRFKSYLVPGFFEHRVHWFALLNSSMMVVFLCGIVALILVRTLREDFAKYTMDEDDMESPEASLMENSGWKQVHGDVFRAPQHLMMFSALHGTGCQLSVVVVLVILFAIAGPLHGHVYEERGEVVSTIIVCYALSSFVNGYTSGSFYRQFFTTPRAEQSSQWQKTMLLSVVLLPSIVFCVMFAINLVAVYYNTMNQIPPGAMIKMALIWMFIAFPLCVTGSMFGRHWGGKGNFPCRINSIPRQIPEAPWYGKPGAVTLLAGVCPFISIFVEMYFLMTAFWGPVYYYVFGFMLLAYVILVIVLVCTTIVAVYVVLNHENYNWHWVSFLSAGSTAVYVFAYSVYFWFKTEQTGFLQTTFYFGYMSLFCVAMFAMCGSIGVFGSTVFVKQIYRNIKVD